MFINIHSDNVQHLWYKNYIIYIWKIFDNKGYRDQRNKCEFWAKMKELTLNKRSPDLLMQPTETILTVLLECLPNTVPVQIYTIALAATVIKKSYFLYFKGIVLTIMQSIIETRGTIGAKVKWPLFNVVNKIWNRSVSSGEPVRILIITNAYNVEIFYTMLVTCLRQFSPSRTTYFLRLLF